MEWQIRSSAVVGLSLVAGLYNRYAVCCAELESCSSSWVEVVVLLSCIVRLSCSLLQLPHLGLFQWNKRCNSGTGCDYPVTYQLIPHIPNTTTRVYYYTIIPAERWRYSCRRAVRTASSGAVTWRTPLRSVGYNCRSGFGCCCPRCLLNSGVAESTRRPKKN